MDANGDGVSDPWNPDDAIFAAARYLAAAGGRTDIARGIFAYNHAQWYVDEILGLARQYGQNGFDIAFTYDRNQANVQAAEKAIATQNRVLDRATLQESRLARRTQVMYARADAAPLLSSRLALEKRAFQVGARRDAAAASVAAAKRKLKAAEKALEQARLSTLTSFHEWGGAPRRPALPGRLRLPGRRRAFGRLGRPLPPRLSRCRHRGTRRLTALRADRRLHRRCVADAQRELRDRPDDPRGPRRPNVDVLPHVLRGARGSSPVSPLRQASPSVSSARRGTRPARTFISSFSRRAPTRRSSPGSTPSRAPLSAGRTHRQWLWGPSSTSSAASQQPPRTIRSDHVHGRKVLTPWPSLPKSEVWLCGSVSSSPGFLRSQSSRCSRPRR